jgi:hypothetical protein
VHELLTFSIASELTQAVRETAEMVVREAARAA